MEKKEAVNVAQQVLALDTRYNACRSLPRQNHMLYLRRRNQLLQENATRGGRDPSIRRGYLHLRAQILAAKYGHLVKSNSRSTGSMRGSGRHSLQLSMESLPVVREGGGRSPGSRDHRRESLLGGLVPTRSAEASRAMAGDTSLAEHYAFCGMHHIFDRHKDAVIAIRFANDDKSRLACASRDGTLSVFNVSTEPPSLLATLSGHRRPVNDFDWSVANEVLVSVSSDGTARLWDSTTGSCLREISDGNSGRALCCRFHPNNNNLVAIGNSKSQVKVFNVSTGKAVKGGSSKLASAALCLAFDSTHSHLWVGGQ
ncbi:WD repeat-containing protein 13 [Geodia barretti]|uniref:WD repeat-containing protein 13 n=1 Tax=Geodia barretti TaxID=519541 RepID=A0AA35WQP0_GEOBA|nr:WD repeat-containing protein 13 [Geodia barretti]